MPSALSLHGREACSVAGGFNWYRGVSPWASCGLSPSKQPYHEEGLLLVNLAEGAQVLRVWHRYLWWHKWSTLLLEGGLCGLEKDKQAYEHTAFAYHLHRLLFVVCSPLCADLHLLVALQKPLP